MPFISTGIPDLLVFEPKVWEDDRGYFYEAFNQQTFEKAGITRPFVQDNEAFSHYGVIRAMHYQLGAYAQAKLVRALQGEVLDVVVDLREDQPTYGKSFSILLSDQNKKQLYVPRGFAHGYSVLSTTASVMYKVDNFYAKDQEGGFHYADPDINIDWQIPEDKRHLAEKDLQLPLFKNRLKG